MGELVYDPNWVEIYEYTQEWMTLFEIEKSALCEVLGDTALDVQHIGSTSIPALSSKPIIDIMVGVEKIETLTRVEIRKLETIEYVFRGDAGIAGRLFFRKGVPRAKFHLSIVKRQDIH